MIKTMFQGTGIHARLTTEACIDLLFLQAAKMPFPYMECTVSVLFQ
jgi:hypothetical protein